LSPLRFLCIIDFLKTAVVAFFHLFLKLAVSSSALLLNLLNYLIVCEASPTVPYALFLETLPLLVFEIAVPLLVDHVLLFGVLDFHVLDFVALLYKVSFQEFIKLAGYFFPMDTLSSRITTIRNAQRAGRPSVLLTPRQGGGTRLGRSILRLLVREGYIDAFSVYSYTSCAQVPSSVGAPLSNQTTFLVHLKYGSHGQPAFHSIQRVSTPARRVYLSSSAL